MARLRAGLIGIGMMGRHHARVLRSLDGVELVAIADAGGDPHNVCGDLSLLPDVDAVISAGVDYCVVSVPTAFHHEVALQLAQAGICALIEKPLASTAEEASEIAAAFAGAGLVGGVGHIERYNPALQQARTRLANGDLGDVYQVSTRRVGPFPSRISDVGVVKDLGTHDIDLTAWVTQQPYESVSARAAHRSGRPHEDLVAITGTLRDGTVANHLVNWLSPLKERLTTITGVKGAFVADTLSADLTFYANGVVPTEWSQIAGFRGVTEGDMIRYSFPKHEPLRTEHEAFRDAVLGDPSRIVSLAQGLLTVKVAESVLEAASSGETVAVRG
ncbi:MAG: Gfo/Idh/MocA family oxidoreductase [Candidatus Nanopelagicales bacterium]|nr:Gfo/Idh/MocA family oxidoreductase [Candidatus Nanopelagicales bacterium]MDZ4250182.1 Gfo/Idh/MocA family oxidoreductase [Candidatus Nanopelagicales bacterium]MDZ7576572.1 Gfo/Idh/MocA family oxidoreductase [Candidatus Nanopelagicales bacterium]